MIENNASIPELTEEQKKQIAEAASAEQKKVEMTKKAKKAIEDFMKELDISTIIYVDDRCSIQELKETFLGRIKQLYVDKPEALSFINWELPEAIFSSTLNALWEEANDDQKRDLVGKLLIFDGNQDDIDNSIAPLTLSRYLQQKIELLSPTQWLEKKDSIVERLRAGKKILFLFDIEFKYAPLASGRNGLDLAKDLFSIEEVGENVFCGIFSHLFNASEEKQKRNDYCDQYDFNKKNFYTISKKRFNNGEYLPGLAEGIRNTLLISEIESLKEKSSKMIKAAFRDAMKEINGLTPESFNHVIQKSSNMEGAWEMATLLRINNIVTNDNALKKLLVPSVRKDVNVDLAKIRKLEAINTGAKTPSDKTQIIHLRERELFVDAKILNNLHFPVSNGDMFSIGGKQFILLAQPCNIALRSNGKRVRNYDTGFLIEIEKITLEVFKNYGKEQLSTLEMIESSNKSVNSVSVASFAKFTTVSLIPLDLTVFNENGRAVINLDITIHPSQTIQQSWKSRYTDVHAEMLKYKNAISAYKKLRSVLKESLKHQLYNGGVFRNYTIDNELSLRSNKLTFDILRTGHYKAPFSADLLQKFMQYLSRNAFDHDFMKDK